MASGLLAVGLSILAAISSVAAYCPVHWQERGTTAFMCYRFLEAPLVRSWDDARQFCQSQSAELTSSLNQWEQDWLVKEITQRNTTNGNNEFWIGLNKQFQPQWKWSDNAVFSASIAPWSPGEPKNTTEANCVKMTLTGNVAVKCDGNLGYICKRSARTPNTCPYNWEEGETDCYRHKSDALPWWDARKDCQSDSGDLVVARDEVVARFVLDHARIENQNVWVGLKSEPFASRKAKANAQWKWVNGNSAPEFETFWAEGYPKINDGEENNTCAQVLNGASDQKKSFVSTTCGESNQYMCQRPKGTCADGWLLYEGICFKMFLGVRGTWKGSKEFCERRGASLPMIKESRVQGFISSNLGRWYNLGVHFMWLGLRAEPFPAPFMWTDGSQLSWSKWGPDEPHRAAGRPDCAFLYTGDKGGGWRARPECQRMRRILCQIPEGVTPIEPTTTAAPYYCEDGWELFRQRCYMFNESPLTWPMARITCTDTGGDLADIRDEETTQFIAERLERYSWVGLHRRSRAGNFTWLDEMDIPTYWNWAPGEPNDWEGNEACVMLYSDEGPKMGQWNDESCNQRWAHICVRPAPISGNPTTPTTPGSPDWTVKCGPMWVDHVGTPWCYQMLPEHVRYNDAQHTCRDLSGELVSVTSPEEHAYLAGSLPPDMYWIGLNDRDDPNMWRWTDKSPLPYFRWAKGFPDSSDDKHCGVYDTTQQQWESRKCSERFKYICKKRGIGPTAIPTPTEPACTSAKFSQAMREEQGMHSDCDHVEGSRNQSLEECKILACNTGGNTFNYRAEGGECYVKQCPDSRLKLITDHGGYSVYTLLACHVERFAQRKQQQQGMHTDCLSITGTFNRTVEQCKMEACRNGANAFNYKNSSGECYVKKCPSRDLELDTLHGGWDVYSTWDCSVAGFDQARNSGDGVHSDCPHLAGERGKSLDECKMYACDKGGNTFNYHQTDGQCYVKDCWGGDLQLREKHGGYEVYTITEFCYLDKFSRRKRQEEGVHSYCPHLTDFADRTLDQCKVDTCQNDGNTFNYKKDGGHCNVKKCARGHLNLENMHGGYDVFSIWSCTVEDIMLKYPADLKRISNCPQVQESTNRTLEQCKIDTCDSGGNTINYIAAEKKCSVRRCSGGSLELDTADNVDVYSTLTDQFETTTSSGFQYTCPQPYVEFNEKCYFFGNRTGLPWDECRHRCIAVWNADLASIHSDEEHDFILAEAKDRFVQPHEHSAFWIGFRDFHSRSYYQWADHSPVVYTNWDYGEPNNYEGMQEHCVEVKMNQGGRWNDEQCDKTSDIIRGFVCKRDRFYRPIPVSTTPRPPPKGCPDDTTFAWMTSCYKRSRRGYWLSWDEAKEECKKFNNGHLVDIVDRFEQARLQAFIPNNGKRFWTGFSNKGNADGKWSWSSGANDGFTNWDRQFTGNERETCAGINTGFFHGMWKAMPNCDRKLRFFCKTPREGFSTPARPTPSGPTPPCEEGWKEFSGYCFQVGYLIAGDDRNKMVWSDAMESCRRKGGDLASVHSKEENDFILNNVPFPNSGSSLYWIGLHNNSGDQEWSDQSAFDYNSWKSGQPESHRDLEKCVQYDFRDGGSWLYKVCSLTANWVCKKQRGAPPSTPTPFPPDSACVPEKLTKRKDQTDRTFSDCPHVVSYGQDKTLEQCKMETCISGGNTFNFKEGMGECYVKKCFGGDLEYRENSRGYDVYSLDVPMCADEGWKHYKSACWYISKNKAGENDVSWRQARAFCWNKGGDLASVHSQEENNVLTRLASYSSQRFLHIGFNRLDLGGWRWSDGTPDDYLNWDRGEPNDHNFGELCTHITTVSGFWNDMNCGNINGFICKKNNDTFVPRTTVATTPVPGFCPDGFLGLGNKCFKLFGKDDSGDRKNWDDSVRECRKLGAQYDLASISSQQEQDLVNIVLDDVLVRTWIGMSKRVYGVTQWVDNSDITYQNWGPGEPNNQAECVEMNYSLRLGKWYVNGCDNNHGRICQYRKDPGDVIATTKVPFPAPCEKPGYVDYLGECYKFVDDNKNWADANQSCIDEGAHLVSVHSRPENAFLTHLTRQHSGDIWIGLNDQEEHGRFKWSSGWYVRYTNWGAGQPVWDDNKRCASILPSGDWNVTSCNDAKAFLCKVIKTQPPPPPPEIEGRCLNDTTWFPHYRHCYKPEVERKMNMALAELECGHDGGQLASVHSIHENYFIQRKVAELNVNYYVWLGLIRPENNAGAWRWTDGTPLEYENWAPGEPSDPEGTIENCVEMYPNNGLWNDIRCEITNKWVCKAEIEVTSRPPTTRPIVPTTSKGFTTTPGATRPTTPPRPPTFPVPTMSPPPGLPPTPPSGEGSPGNSGLSQGDKVGIAFGVIGCILFILVLTLVALKRHRDQIPSALKRAIEAGETSQGVDNPLYFSSQRDGSGSLQVSGLPPELPVVGSAAATPSEAAGSAGGEPGSRGGSGGGGGGGGGEEGVSGGPASNNTPMPPPTTNVPLHDSGDLGGDSKA